MKTVKVRFSLSLAYSTAKEEEELEFRFADDATDDEIKAGIEEEHREWIYNNIDGYWKIID